ncbi:hypothetical protein J3458_022068 [Metarhizium acridum]|uniref:uncharacterized protein n=1 Tax=Metarhizium acridum TaxID=92637 RepID=UPI001C6AD5F0|nr:hypothetical protein J3458_022068 [Metarhizium acridum]
MNPEDHAHGQYAGRLQHVQRLFGDRWYGRSDDKLKRSKYIFPIDQEELQRLDIFHKLFLTARGNALFSSPLDTTTDLRILDLGTGTGIWSIDMAEALPRASVLGVDMNMIQPERIPANMEPPMEFDIESDWKPMERNWDLIHVRTLFGAVRCWEDMYRKIHRHLKPNVGYLEQVEIDWEPRFKGGNIPYKCALVDWTDKLLRAMDRHGRSMRVEPERTRRQLRTAGFSDIHDCSIRVGFTPWSEDRHERDVALWFGAGFSRAIKALSYGPMSLYLTMAIKDIDLLCEAVLDDLRTARYKAYCRM